MFRFSPKNEKIIAQKKFFVWDFDGSFSNTERLHFNAYRDAFAEHGHNLCENHYYESFTHKGKGAQREIEKNALPLNPDLIMARKKEHFWRRINEDTIPEFPGALSLLQILQRHGTIAIASNSSQQEILTVLKRTALDEFPKLIVGKEDYLRSKPAPDIFLRAVELLNAQPEQVIVFEDSERGLAAAHAANLQAILVQTEFNCNLSFTSPYLEKASHQDLASAFSALFSALNTASP